LVRPSHDVGLFLGSGPRLLELHLPTATAASQTEITEPVGETIGTMSASLVQGDSKQSRTPSREGHQSSPESSLAWCLAHLSKPGPGAEHHGHGKSDSGGGREMDKRSRVSQWRALVAIRTQHIKGDKAGIATFRTQGGLRPLLDLLKHPDCSRKTLDLALSILGNCCTDEWNLILNKNVTALVEILRRNVALETVQNRAARALGNLAMDPESSALIHSAGGVSLLLLCVSLSSGRSSPSAAPLKDTCPKLECAQSAARALLYLSDTPSNRMSLLTQGTLSALAPLIAPEYPQGLRRATLRTLHELTRGCGVECAREVSRSGVLAQLGVMVSEESGKPFEELALKTLANMCSQGCLRPLVGSLGVIQKFTEEIKKDPLKSGVFLKALCLCCKEAVNRAKVKESGGLEVLIGFMSAHQSHPLSRLVILACVDFVFDESAMEQLQELGLVPLLVARLVELTRGEEQSAEKMDVSLSSTPGKEQGLCSSSFLSLRSWLVSEGLITSEGDLLDSSGVEGEWGTACLTKVILDTPPSAPRQTAYQHPYHPEPWTPESPILLLLSRFSHTTDPSAALVSSGVMSGLLYYLTQHQDPSSRCLRMLCRLSCNPNCLQALVRTGSVALIFCNCVLTLSVGVTLLNNLRVQCESGFGSGVLAHVMLSGSETDKMNCALSLPLISSNKSLLKKLLLDSGGLLLHSGLTSRLHSLYFSLLSGCLSTLMGGIKIEFDKKYLNSVKTPSVAKIDRASPPPLKKPRMDDICPYGVSNFDLLLLLDDGTKVPANREAVAGLEGKHGVGSEYFWALLRGGFGEAQGNAEEAIRIKDVSTGMLLPVLHFLHGCEDHSAEDLTFQKTLQRELEDLCVSLLLSCSTKAASRAASAPTEDNAASKMDQEGLESAEENLANRTSELELTGSEA
uniref:Armadillo repeat containing 5 n=1 Tax=Sparus aurata TaxID=8175 RepID=A0A671Y9J2_SPAAU